MAHILTADKYHNMTEAIDRVEPSRYSISVPSFAPPKQPDADHVPQSDKSHSPMRGGESHRLKGKAAPAKPERQGPPPFGPADVEPSTGGPMAAKAQLAQPNTRTSAVKTHVKREAPQPVEVFLPYKLTLRDYQQPVWDFFIQDKPGLRGLTILAKT